VAITLDGVDLNIVAVLLVSSVVAAHCIVCRIDDNSVKPSGEPTLTAIRGQLVDQGDTDILGQFLCIVDIAEQPNR